LQFNRAIPSGGSSGGTWTLLNTFTVPTSSGADYVINNLSNVKGIYIVFDNLMRGSSAAYSGVQVNTTGSSIGEIRGLNAASSGYLLIEDMGLWSFEYAIGASYGSSYNIQQASYYNYVNNNNNKGGSITMVTLTNLISGTLKVYVKS
jgi:hypothetical protein